MTEESIAAVEQTKAWMTFHPQVVEEGEERARLETTASSPLAPAVGITATSAAELTKALNTVVLDVPVAVVKELVKASAFHDPRADPILKKGKPEPDVDLRDAENVPLPPGFIDLDDTEQEKALFESAEEYLEREIRPYVADAWIDHSKTKVGYEIPFTRQFYINEPPRPVEEIAAEIRDLEEQIQGWMRGVGL